MKNKTSKILNAFGFVFVMAILFMFNSCSNQDEPDSKNTGQAKSNQIYRPGLGEFMSSIQMHHAKLWFAGVNSNWKLAEYETSELKELFENTQKYASDRPEVKSIAVMDVPVDSVSIAIQKQDLKLFKHTFQKLTYTCNSCHEANKFYFNVITIPTALPVTNQDFKIQKK